METTCTVKLPPADYRRTIEELSIAIPDPALKLKFLKQALNEYQKISAKGEPNPKITDIDFRQKLLDNREKIWPGSKKVAQNIIHKDIISAPNFKKGRQKKLPYAVGSAIILFCVLWIGLAISQLGRSHNDDAIISPTALQSKAANEKIIIRKPIIYSQPSNEENNPLLKDVKSAEYLHESGQVLKYLQNPVLAFLSPLKTQNAASDHNAEKPLLSSQLHATERYSAKLGVESEVLSLQKETGWRPGYLQNPILMALAPQHFDSLKTVAISNKPLSSFQLAENQNRSLPKNSVPQKSLKEDVHGLKYLQNPILMALAPQHSDSLKTAAVSNRPLSKGVNSGKIRNDNHSHSHAVKSEKYRYATDQFPEYLQKPIWLVEKTPDREIYSNRLQIITTYTISNEPREYYRFPKTADHWPPDGEVTDKISGIVYHASESDVYPFMPEMNHSILKYSKQLIKYLLRKKSYHFFIDRFGRVYRLVREDHAAFHAGNSIWADDEEIYLNLNQAFIGICFEGKDFEEINISKQKKGRPSKSKSTLLKPTGISSFNEAQLRSGKELTDWLRVKYGISQHNCVPHALISVNPDKMLIGWHLDLSRGFPFAKFGLSDKYREPLPSMVEFGFSYDRYFEKIFNGNLWQGILWSEDILHRQARNSGMGFAEYRKRLHQKFIGYTEWEESMLENKNQLQIKTQKWMDNEDQRRFSKK